MGNGVGKQLSFCFADGADSGVISGRHVISVYLSDEGLLGHSFAYFQQNPLSLPSPSPPCHVTTFKSISGASLSANTSTPLSTQNDAVYYIPKHSSFESSDLFSSIPLQPIPRASGPSSHSAPIPKSPCSGFLSGPIERAFISGPIDGQLDQAVINRKSNSKKMNLIKKVKKILRKKGSWKKNNKNEIGSVGEIDDEFHEQRSNNNVQWAQGKAGEDRVHMVVSEEDGLVFVGIYDGFNGPDATDFLLNNLYSNVHKELKGLLWDELSTDCDMDTDTDANCDFSWKRRKKGDTEDIEVKHSDVLRALSEGLRRTEESFLEIADLMLVENPELCLMGSCVLVMVMKGEDVYVMNVGDSRAVIGKIGGGDLELLNSVGSWGDFENMAKLTSVQLTQDHSTSVEEEVKRIKKEHQVDVCAITNDRVKGSLKVTRAFGAGFLKQPKWNNALLEMFRIDYVGNSPYINCIPSLHHHRLSPKDKFLILSSDGLYQYFTNEEAISEIEIFISQFPEGDPAQHLIEEVLFRAAKKAGMDFHELLDIPQGDRRRYHDDISIVIISFEGRIWRSSI